MSAGQFKGVNRARPSRYDYKCRWSLRARPSSTSTGQGPTGDYQHRHELGMHFTRRAPFGSASSGRRGGAADRAGDGFEPGDSAVTERRRASAGSARARHSRRPAELHRSRFRPLRPEDRARHAQQCPRLPHPRRHLGRARARPGDRQRAGERSAPGVQIGRPVRADRPHSGRQRRADRHCRRRDAVYSRPFRPGCRHHHQARRVLGKLQLARRSAAALQPSGLYEGGSFGEGGGGQGRIYRRAFEQRGRPRRLRRTLFHH